MELLPPPINIKQFGFTLVELSIVMIIIGLLIGGIFGGMKLIDNANVQKTVQDLKSIESAALTFKDTYRTLPGDIRNPSTRIPNCTEAPCATGGNGDRNITESGMESSIDASMEKFTFWHHLQAAGLIQMDYHNTIDMSFGEGQPSSPIGGGYRLSSYTGPYCFSNFRNAEVLITNIDSAAMNSAQSVPCNLIWRLDTKMDDGRPSSGRIIGHWGCDPTACSTTDYQLNNTGRLTFDANF